MFEKFTEGAIKVVMLAQEESRRMGHNFVGTEQLLLGVIGQRHGVGGRALAQMGITVKRTRKEIEKYIGRGTGFVASEIPFTPRAKRVLEMSISEGHDLGVAYVGTEHILLSLINETEGIAFRMLNKLKVNIPKLKHLVLSYIEEQQEDISMSKLPLSEEEKWSIALQKASSITPTLDLYSSNLSQEVREMRIDPVLGRDKEIKALITILARRRKNNPVLIGEAGVGKTACAEGLALLLESDENCPDFLKGYVVRGLDLGAILAGTKYRGEFEERMKSMITEILDNGKIILVIDELHTLVGAGAAEGAVDAANLLKPALARGLLKVIGATTVDEYHKYIEKDPALERRFHSIIVEAPSVETTIEILRGLRERFEAHHTTFYEDSALIQAAVLSDRFISDRNLPDKAIDVMDEAGARNRLRLATLPVGFQKLLVELQTTLAAKDAALMENDFDTAKNLTYHEMEVRAYIRIMKFSLNEQGKGKYPDTRLIDHVCPEDVTSVVSLWTGIPVTKIGKSENERLKNMENILHSRIIGQHHAIIAISNAVRRARVGFQDEKRPLGSFIFAGPSGVGKTELTKALAEYLFDDEKNLIRFDMSEYMEKHTASKLIGSPPGYIGFQDGGQLTEAVRRKPYSVVLFDEIEKAHPDIFNLFLQILDDGHISDSSGKIISFKNCIIIMTTNLGCRMIMEDQRTSPKYSNSLYSPRSLSDSEVEPDRISLVANSDGTFSLQPPVKPEITKADNEQYVKMTESVSAELKKFFRPEFLNRVDEIIVFNKLSSHDIWEIAGLLLKQLIKRLKKSDIELKIDNSVQYYVSKEGYDPAYGARPLRRVITKFIEDDLAVWAIGGGLSGKISLELEKKASFSFGNLPSYYRTFDDLYEPKLKIVKINDGRINDEEHKENNKEKESQKTYRPGRIRYRLSA
uniref:Clp protease ATP binding subunit n=1 Tax=Discostella guiyangensis TaxID=3145224 RepID=A0AB74TQG7_9STRA